MRTLVGLAVGAVAFVIWTFMVVIAAAAAILDQIWPWLLAFGFLGVLASGVYLLCVWSRPTAASQAQRPAIAQPYAFHTQPQPYGFYTPQPGLHFGQQEPWVQRQWAPPSTVPAIYGAAPAVSAASAQGRIEGNHVVLHQRRRASRFVAGSRS